jgi:hypothetical protein
MKSCASLQQPEFRHQIDHSQREIIPIQGQHRCWVRSWKKLLAVKRCRPKNDLDTSASGRDRNVRGRRVVEVSQLSTIRVAGSNEELEER